MKKKMLSLLLASGMVLSLVACGSKPAEESKEESKKEETKQEESKEEASEEVSQELTTVKILCRDGDVNDDYKISDWMEFAVGQHFAKDLEEIGIRLELEFIDGSGDDFVNVVKTRMASGVDLPDLISYAFCGSSDDVVEWGKSGLVYSVTDLVEQYDEDGSIRAFYEKYAPGLWNANALEDGSVYWFSYIYGPQGMRFTDTGELYTSQNPWALSIRKDWVEAIGEECKDVYTPEEMLDLLEKIQANDANGNGVKDEVICADIDGFSTGFATAYGLTRSRIAGYFEGENEVFANVLHENYPDYIRFMQELYKKGLYDSINLSMSQDEMISQDRVSAAYSYARWEYEVNLPDASKDQDYYYPVIIDLNGDLSDGFNMAGDGFVKTLYNQHFVPKASENAEAVVRMMDLVYTDYYADLTEYGVEGLGHTVTEEGYKNKIREGAIEEIAGLGKVMFSLYVLPYQYTIEEYAANFEGTLDEDKQSKQYRKTKEYWVYKFDTEYFDTIDKFQSNSQLYAVPTEEESAWLSENTVVLDSYISELNADLIMGNKSLDDLDKYLTELEELGLSKYVEIMQARRDRVVNGK